MVVVLTEEGVDSATVEAAYFRELTLLFPENVICVRSPAREVVNRPCLHNAVTTVFLAGMFGWRNHLAVLATLNIINFINN